MKSQHFAWKSLKDDTINYFWITALMNHDFPARLSSKLNTQYCTSCTKNKGKWALNSLCIKPIMQNISILFVIKNIQIASKDFSGQCISLKQYVCHLDIFFNSLAFSVSVKLHVSFKINNLILLQAKRKYISKSLQQNTTANYISITVIKRTVYVQKSVSSS